MGVSQQSLRTGGGESELKEQQTCERTNQPRNDWNCCCCGVCQIVCFSHSDGQTDRRLRRSAGCETSAAASSFSLSLRCWRQEKRVKPIACLPACLPAGREAPPPRQLLTWTAEFRCLREGSSRKVKHFETASAGKREAIQGGCLFVCLFHGMSEAQCGAPLRLCEVFER